MAIELKIGTRGTRAELLYTFTQDFLDEHGIRKLVQFVFVQKIV